MKTYIKGIKTVAVIFLSLVLFSCQDEQIELQDTLSTADQVKLKGPKLERILSFHCQVVKL